MAKVVIIGGGPSGVSAALYTKRAGIDTVILEKGIGALGKAHALENYYGFSEPISGADLYENGLAQAKRLGVQVINGEVYSLGFESTLQVISSEGTFDCDAIILATGATRNAPKIDGIKEFEGRGVSYCAVCDGFFHKGKQVAVLGSGDYAIHEAQALLPIALGVTILTDGEDMTKDLPEGVSVSHKKIAKITGEDLLSSVVFEDGSSLEISGLFVAQGTAGSTDLARKLGVLAEGNKIVVDENMATNIPGIYAVGDCTGGMMQVCKAVYDGAVAAKSVIAQFRK